MSQLSEGPLLDSVCAGYRLTAFQLQSHLDASPSEGRGAPETFRAVGTALSFVPEGSGVHAGGRDFIPGSDGRRSRSCSAPCFPASAPTGRFGHGPPVPGLFSMDSFPHTPEGRFPASSLRWISSFCQPGTTVAPSPFSKI